MKITLSLEEVMHIVERHIINVHGVPVKADSGTIVSHIEGQYDDEQKVVDGLSFEIL